MPREAALNRIFHDTLLCLFVACCAACGHDRASRPHAAVPDNDASLENDASASASDGGVPPEIVALTQRAVDAYDRQIKASCTCLAAVGAYDSEEACTKLLGSGPTWADCGAKVLAENNGPDTRVQIDCFVATAEQQADCVESAGCDTQAFSSCSSAPSGAAGCSTSQGTLVEQLLQRCPDLGLLSR